MLRELVFGGEVGHSGRTQDWTFDEANAGEFLLTDLATWKTPMHYIRNKSQWGVACFWEIMEDRAGY